MADYCNINTDLTDVFPRINDYQLWETVDGWTKTSGQTYVYERGGTGYVSQAFEDNKKLTSQSSIGDTDSNAGSFYYDASNDILYVHAVSSDDPADHDIQAGDDWVTVKTRMRDKSQQIIDAYLNPRYETPLLPRVRQHHDSASYEYPIVRATALLTCYLLVNRRQPGAADAQALYTEALNEDEATAPLGIIPKILNGDIVLQDQVSSREAGHWNIYAASGNSTTEPGIRLKGQFTGAQYQKWKLVIDGAGAPGTATYKLSLDGGSNYDYTTQDTRSDTSDNLYVNLAYGVDAYFPQSSYTLNDEWEIEVYPVDASIIGAKIGSITLCR